MEIDNGSAFATMPKMHRQAPLVLSALSLMLFIVTGMAKEQRIVFVLKKMPDGNLGVNVNMHPKMAKDEKAFRELPIYQQELQSAAANIGKHVMEFMMKE